VLQSYVNQNATQLIGLSAAQQQFPTGAGIVAIIDTGVDPTHPALQNVVLPGYDFTRSQAGASELLDLTATQLAALQQSTVAILDQSTVAILDQSTVAILDGVTSLPTDFGHGTMVAGLVHLVAPTSSILPLKAFQSDGTGHLSNIVQAIYYAVNNGASVINMSFSLQSPSPVLQAAIGYASSNGVISVASAGNNGGPVVVYPAGLNGVIGVASTNAADQRSPFSNYGVPSVFMAAPGEALITSFPGEQWAGVWGTSFSTALVSGTTALLLQSGASSFSGVETALSNGQPVAPSQEVGADILNVFLSLQSLTGGSGGSGGSGQN
jgi:subtilisin family serine protease